MFNSLQLALIQFTQLFALKLTELIITVSFRS